MLVWSAVVLIGGCGSLLRFVVDGAVGTWLGRDFPFGTLVVNLSGAIVLGLLTGLVLDADASLLAGTAAVGSYTTFSTWLFETQRLDEERQHRSAFINVVVSLVLGVAAAALGRWIGGAAVNRDCLKLTTYFGERARFEDRFVADALLDLYGRHELATSVLLRGMAGFGRKHRLRTDISLTLSEDLPMVGIAVDTRERIEQLVDDVHEIVGTGLVTLERARLSTQPSVMVPDELRDAAKLTVYLGRHERAGRGPTYAAVCEVLRRSGVAGATALLGVDGTVDGRRERAKFFGRNAAVPMLVIAVGSGERIAAAMPELGALVRHPLTTLERVQVCKRDGELLQTPHPLPGTDEHGRPLWQKLMIYTSEGQLHEGLPIHRALVRQLRESGASGATTLRGIWGFHGDHEPHGDRVFQFGRHVPAVTTVIDRPERAQEWFAIVDALTTAARAGHQRAGADRPRALAQITEHKREQCS